MSTSKTTQPTRPGARGARPLVARHAAMHMRDHLHLLTHLPTTFPRGLPPRPPNPPTTDTELPCPAACLHPGMDGAEMTKLGPPERGNTLQQALGCNSHPTQSPFHPARPSAAPLQPAPHQPHRRRSRCGCARLLPHPLARVGCARPYVPLTPCTCPVQAPRHGVSLQPGRGRGCESAQKPRAGTVKGRRAITAEGGASTAGPRTEDDRAAVMDVGGNQVEHALDLAVEHACRADTWARKKGWGRGG